MSVRKGSSAHGARRRKVPQENDNSNEFPRQRRLARDSTGLLLSSQSKMNPRKKKRGMISGFVPKRRRLNKLKKNCGFETRNVFCLFLRSMSKSIVSFKSAKAKHAARSRLDSENCRGIGQATPFSQSVDPSIFKVKESSSHNTPDIRPTDDECVTHAIFEALFGHASKLKQESSENANDSLECYVSNWIADVDNEKYAADCQRFTSDENWFSAASQCTKPELPHQRYTSLPIHSPLFSCSSALTPLLSSTAFEYALNSAHIDSSAHKSLMDDYITEKMINMLVYQLSSVETPTPPAYSVLKSLYRCCPSKRPSILKATVFVSCDVVSQCKKTGDVARLRELSYEEAQSEICRNSIHSDVLVKGQINHIAELALFITHFELKLNSSQISSTGANSLQLHTASLLSVIINGLRCYSEPSRGLRMTSEEPSVLVTLLKALDMCFIYNNSFGTVAHDFDFLELVLSKLLKYWPRGDAVQELAFWKAVSVALPYCKPKSILYADACMGDSSIPKNGKKVSSVTRVLRKLLATISSYQFSISMLVIQIAMRKEILFPLIMSQPSKSSCSMEVFREKIRSNCKHWHASVRELSENSLMKLEEYLHM